MFNAENHIVNEDENHQKTRMRAFLELYPNAQVDNRGIPLFSLVN